MKAMLEKFRQETKFALVEAKLEATEGRADVTCPICTEPALLNAVKTKDCQHMFHRDCLLTWIKKKPTCPVCRNSLNGLDFELNLDNTSDDSDDDEMDGDF